jgi:hypothetical protein
LDLDLINGLLIYNARIFPILFLFRNYDLMMIDWRKLFCMIGGTRDPSRLDLEARGGGGGRV